MKFEIVDDGSEFDRYCDMLDQEEADRREANIAKALAEALEQAEVTS